MEGWTLLAQGAESKVYLAKGIIDNEEESIIKDRFPKRYRHIELENKLSKQRFSSEVKCMLKAIKAGVDVPRIDYVDKNSKRIIMEYIRGVTIKQFFLDMTKTKQDKIIICKLIGETVGKLHNIGLCHGDLTTSNLMLRTTKTDQQQQLTVIDFGLSFMTKAYEDMGVDLYVLKRAFVSTHPETEDFFQIILESYSNSHVKAKNVVQVFEEVQLRGRKRVAFG